MGTPDTLARQIEQAERKAQQAAERLKQLKTRRAAIEARQKAIEAKKAQQAIQRRVQQAGVLVQRAGLLDLDDATLFGALLGLAEQLQVPDALAAARQRGELAMAARAASNGDKV